PVPPQYGLVFDAGSTHTSLYIYRWPAHKENGTGIVSQVEACSVSGECVGICSPSLPVSWIAVPNSHSTITDPSLSACFGLKGDCPVKNHRKGSAPEGALQSLGGAEVGEGLGPHFAQVLQPVLSRCASPHSLGCWIEVSQHSPCTPGWDRGRAQCCGRQGCSGSSQVGCIQSSWGVGPAFWDGLWDRSQWHGSPINGSVSLQASSSAEISHPCYPRGYQENLTVAELYDSPCVHAPSSASPGLVLRVTGTGDPAGCGTAVQRLFNFSCGAQGPCGFNGVYQPPVRGHFFAYSGFYHSLHFLNLTGGQSLSFVNATIWQICNSSWEQLQGLFPTASRSQLCDACAASSYTLTLLLQGYKFNNTTWPNIHFVQQVANVDVGWTLGCMLNLTNIIPSEPLTAVTELPRSIWIAATVLLAIMLILTFCLLTAMCYQRNSSGYEQL
ncbi:ENTP8 diphosphohydrolase, partial [Cercotrichas coryphoeus]|nr:ENTP8 diphosphohydrolase [Cercotrichas coryphoeus]